MKKKIIITLLTVIMLAILSVTAGAFALGDVNGDGAVKAADARLALRYSAKLEELSENQIKAADVDNSGKVTASDARKILRVSAKLDLPFEGIDINEHLIEKGVLNVAVPKDNAPFAYEENGELKGIDVSTMKQFAEKMNLELKLHPMSYDECLDAVKNKKCDIATSVNGSEKPDGFAKPKTYYTNALSVIVLKSSSINSVAQVKDNASIRIGVLDNTIGKITVEKIADKSQIIVFSTCKDAVEALKKGSIDAFVVNDDYTSETTYVNDTVKKLDGKYYSYKHAIIVTKKNSVMLDKISSYITASGIKDYEKVNTATVIYPSQKEVTLAPGGAACVEITVESFFTYTPDLYTPQDTSLSAHQIVEINNKKYIFISTYADRTCNGRITVCHRSGDISNKCFINITIDNAGPKHYQYFDGVNIPDFGVFTGTSPMQTEVDAENKVVVHSYDAETLYFNGITESSQIEAYFDSLEAAGYTYMGYQEIANTISLVFGNEKTEKVVTYVEAYDEEGYLVAIGVGYMLPDYMF